MNIVTFRKAAAKAAIDALDAATKAASAAQQANAVYAVACGNQEHALRTFNCCSDEAHAALTADRDASRDASKRRIDQAMSELRCANIALRIASQVATRVFTDFESAVALATATSKHAQETTVRVRKESALEVISDLRKENEERYIFYTYLMEKNIASSITVRRSIASSPACVADAKWSRSRVACSCPHADTRSVARVPSGNLTLLTRIKSRSSARPAILEDAT